MDWYAETLRLTLIGVTDWAQRPMFSEISGALPAQINAQPPLQTHQEMGSLSEGYLVVSQRPGRIDVTLSDQPTRNTNDSAAPDYRPLFWIAPVKESLEIFDDLSAKVVSIVPGAARLAYAVTLIRPTADVREAVKCLHPYLPTVEFDPDCDTDLSFQINRPRLEKSRLINRLAKWETLQIAQLTLGFGPPLASQKPSVFAARIYVDVSTDANNLNTFPRHEMSELYNVLRTHAIEIVENGDRK